MAIVSNRRRSARSDKATIHPEPRRDTGLTDGQDVVPLAVVDIGSGGTPGDVARAAGIGHDVGGIPPGDPVVVALPVGNKRLPALVK